METVEQHGGYKMNGVQAEAGFTIPDIFFDEANLTAAHDYQAGYKKAARIGLEFIANFCRAVKGYEGDRALAFDCALAAIGQWTILGVKDQAELGKRWGLTRAAINAAVVEFRDKMGIKNMPGDRKDAHRKRMTKARFHQLQ